MTSQKCSGRRLSKLRICLPSSKDQRYKRIQKNAERKGKKDTCITEMFFRSFSIPAGMRAIVDSVICLCKIK